MNPRIKSVNLVTAEWRAQQRMTAGSAKVDTAFGSSCACDAKGEVEKAAAETAKAGSDLAQLLGGAGISDSAGGLEGIDQRVNLAGALAALAAV